jgi:hypothetical protein
MNLHKQLYSTVFLFSLSSALAGCSSYGKCASGACGGDAAIKMNIQRTPLRFRNSHRNWSPAQLSTVLRREPF